MPRGVEKDVTVEQLYMIFILLSSHGSDAVIDHILSEDLTKESTAFLLNMLRSPTPLKLILRLLGIIFTRNTGQIKIAVENKMVQHLSGIFRRFKKDKWYENVIKEGCWLIARVIAADASQIQEIFTHELIGHVIDFGKTDMPGTYPPEEVVWVLSTIAIRGSPDETLSLLQKDVIGMMCMNLLDGQDDLVIISLFTFCLQTLQRNHVVWK